MEVPCHPFKGVDVSIDGMLWKYFVIGERVPTLWLRLRRNTLPAPMASPTMNSVVLFQFIRLAYFQPKMD